ncbi:ras-related protein RABA1f-like [Hibiscus syriacus]|uniref:Ras-related protein RABA1f-like n=1 Tax=Hibiscus syriacus TaxID=106335 RepID=A0A6A3A340_HIBSY|nr:ras-related protein RABA1f-like [Hibiscus syriacus]
MSSTEEETGSTTKPISLYDAALPTEPLLFKPSTSSTYPSPPIEEPSQFDPTQFIQITFNSGPRPFKDLPLPCLSTLHLRFRYNGKIVAKASNGEYTCVWKQDSWVPAYFTLAILTMLWSLTTMVEAQVYVQWHHCSMVLLKG